MLTILAAWKAKAAAFWLASKAKVFFYGMIAVGVVIVAGFIYSMGASSERGKCDMRALQSQIDALKKDLDLARAAAADEKIKAEKLDALAAKQAQELREYENVVKNIKGACVLSPDDARSLR